MAPAWPLDRLFVGSDWWSLRVLPFHWLSQWLPQLLPPGLLVVSSWPLIGGRCGCCPSIGSRNGSRLASWLSLCGL
eukprot:1194661-Prorocentrum_minimum.AAC.7